jgi:hypothetical protein
MLCAALIENAGFLIAVKHRQPMYRTMPEQQPYRRADSRSALPGALA